MPIDIGGGSLFWTSGIRTSGLRRDSKVIQGEFAKLGASGGKLGRLLSPKVLGIAGLVIGLEQIGEAAFKFSKEFESAFAQVKTISAQTVDGFADMERGILELTTQIPVGATESAEALYQIVSAGIDGADAMHLLEVASKAAVGGVTEVETAADGLTTIINAFSLAASDAEEIAAALFTTVKLGKTTFGELSSSIAQAASIAANSGIEYQELLAAITTLTKSGVPTAQAVTQVRSAILAVTEVLGDGAFAGRTMQEAFILVREASKGSNTELRVMLGRVEALNAVLGLTGAKAKSAAEDLTAIKTETENANDAFAIMVQTTENQFKLLSNNIKEGFLKPVGDALIEVARNTAKGINKIFTNSEDRIKAGVRGLLQLADIEIKKAETKDDTFTATAAESRKLFKQQEELNKQIKELRDLRSGDFILGVEKLTSLISRPLESIVGDIGLTAETDLVALINVLIEQRDAIDTARRELDKRLEKIGTDAPVIDFSKLLSGDIKGSENDVNKLILQLKKAIRTSGITEEVKEALEEKLKAATEGLTIFSDVSIKELERQFKEAIEKGKIEEAVKIKIQITVEEDKINAALDKVEKIIIKKASDITAKGSILTIDAKGIEKAKKGFEIIKGKVKVIAGQIKKIDTGLSPIPEKTKSLGDNLSDASQSMNDLAIFAGQFDGELAESIQKIAGIASGLGTILSAQGNPFQILSGGLQILTGLFSSVDNEQEKIDARTEHIRATIQAQNILLERQIQLLNDLAGVDRTVGEADVLALIDRQVKEIDELAISMGLLVNQTTAWSSSLNQIDVTGIEDLILQLQGFLTGTEGFTLFGGVDFRVDNLTEVQGLIDEYNALIARRRELLEELVQTSSEGIADVIRDGFADGKSTIADFADTFEDLMKNAILESFKTQTLLVASKGFFDEFAELSRGGLTAQEIETLRNSFGTIINTASEQFTALNDIFNQTFGTDLFGDVTGQADSLAGQIGRAITEDSATLFIGLLTRTGFDTREQVVLQINMVELQTDIASNTLRTAIACESLDSKISESNQTDRDSGLNLG